MGLVIAVCTLYSYIVLLRAYTLQYEKYNRNEEGVELEVYQCGVYYSYCIYLHLHRTFVRSLVHGVMYKMHELG